SIPRTARTGASPATVRTSSSPATEGAVLSRCGQRRLSTTWPAWLPSRAWAGICGPVSRLGAAARTTVSALGDLVLPVRCGGCDVSGVPWCPSCERTLAAAPPARSWTPTPVPAGLPPVWTVLPYDGPTRAALVNWKDHGRRDL